ncbi:hypothetical protein ACFYYH_00195 [Streptomyces sp. NPDC002018]|uniref:hypothetical protein n=1 Tax=Streptomyces sp. NPDC002018 TaxID=3364629 RepID=UPI0036BA23DE
MTENVWVSCPSCGGGHAFVAAVHPCACGAPVTPPLADDVPVEPITYRSWAEEWVAVRCTACGREDDWPRPELGCPCGTVLRIPVRPMSPTAPGTSGAPGASGAPGTSGAPVAPGAPETFVSPEATGVTGIPETGTHAGAPAAGGADRAGPLPLTGPPAHIPLPRTAASPRPSFRPLTIRSAHDVVTAAALYLRWLGFKNVVRAGEGTETASYVIDLRGRGVVAQVEPTTRPVTPRAVECLWLNGLNASAVGVFFSLSGYADNALARAGDLGVPLFVLDLTGTPRPINGPADELLAAGARPPGA